MDVAKVYRRGDTYQVGWKGWFFYYWYSDSPADRYFNLGQQFSTLTEAKRVADYLNDKWREVM